MKGRVALAALAGVVVLVVSTAPAVAETFQKYCNKNTPPKTRCNEYPDPDHSWERNKVDAPWTGGAWKMCERITEPHNYNTIYSRRCGNALSVTGYWDDYCNGCHEHDNDGNIIRCWVGNDADWPRIIRGSCAYGIFDTRRR
jgi:hypothetical protein